MSVFYSQQSLLSFAFLNKTKTSEPWSLSGLDASSKTKTSKEANDVWEKSKKLADLAKIGPSSEVEYRTSIKYVNRNENIELRPKLYVKKIYPQGGKI